MKYNLQLLKENELECNWKTIYVGRKLGLISHSLVTNFAIDIVKNDENTENELILELTWDLDEEDADKILEILINQLYNLPMNEGSFEWNMEMRKWRYCILMDIIKNMNSKEDVYESIEEIFSKFKYPKDMRHFFTQISDKNFYSMESEDDIIRNMKEIIYKFLETDKLQ